MTMSDTGSVKSFSTCNKITLIMSVIAISSSIGTYFYSQTIIKQKIHQNIIIGQGSPAYEFWINPPASIFRKYYLLDVTNPEEVERGEKPFLSQRGPYVYREVWEKRNIEFLGLNLLSFSPVTTLLFEPDLSTGLENDSITFVNVPALAMIEMSTKGSYSWIPPKYINDLFSIMNTKLFMTKTVRELIAGYKDPLLELAKFFMPSLIKDDTFSLLKGENASEFQNFTIMTGYDNAENVAKIVTWNGLEKLDFWYSHEANLINGTDATFFPPFMTKNTNLYAFNSDMCRSYSLTFLKENEVVGLKTYDFHLDPKVFANSSTNPLGNGFCDGPCLGNGVLNISKCYGGVSGFVSQPHFLNADKKFIEDVEGLNPDENKHDFVLHFEPLTGVPLGGNIRLQIGFYMFQNESIDLVKNVKSALIPMFWFDETIKIYENISAQLSQVVLISKLTFILPLVIASIGMTVILLNLAFVFYKYKNSKSQGVVDENTRLLSTN